MAAKNRPDGCRPYAPPGVEGIQNTFPHLREAEDLKKNKHNDIDPFAESRP